MKDIKGMGVALITPFTQEEQVDYVALKKIVEYIVESGTDFLCILCTTSESPTLTDEEKSKIKQTIIEVVKGRIPIVLGCGGNCTSSVVNELKNGNFDGIDAILSIVPYYNKPTQDGIFKHFSAIAESSPLPIILYNVPSRVGVNMTAETTLKLAYKYNNIIAIKEASGAIEQIDYIIKNCPKSFSVLSGDDCITYPLITMGARGVISVLGNAFPNELSQMIKFALNENFYDALKIHRSFKDLYPLLFVDGNPAGIKAVLEYKGWCKNILRLPLLPARIGTYKEIQKIVANINLLDK